MRFRGFLPAVLLLVPGALEAQQTSQQQPPRRQQVQQRQQPRPAAQPKARVVRRPVVSRVEPIRRAIAIQDLLAARVLVKELARSNVTLREWIFIRELLFANPEIGSDILIGWDRLMPPADDGGISKSIETIISKGDELLLGGNPQGAFELFQKAAGWFKQRMALKNAPKAASYMYPYVLHSMARALFAAGRFDDSLEVYTWLTPDYPRFRQTLFEKMWAAFKAGKLDYALGAVASQRSAYFSKYLEPEAYLIEIYILKVLCRDRDLSKTLAEIQEYKAALESQKHDFRVWAATDFETRNLLRVTELKPDEPVADVSATQRDQEKAKISALLEQMFKAERTRIMDHLGLVQAYANLAVAPGIGNGLTPIDKLPSRADLFKMNLEIWPADSQENWIDELGRHRFMGESLCGK